MKEMKANDLGRVREPEAKVDKIIFALASPIRRRLLEQLADRAGQRLMELRGERRSRDAPAC